MRDDFLVSRDGLVATLTINRPGVRNAISLSMWRDLPDRVKALDEDPEIRVIVVRGAGEKAFASGADISEFEATMSTPEGAMDHSAAYEGALSSVEAASKPVIAMIRIGTIVKASKPSKARPTMSLKPNLVFPLARACRG